MKKRNMYSQCERGQQMKHKRRVLHVRIRCGSLSITTTVAHFESNYSSYYSNYSSIRTSIVATIVLLEINGGSGVSTQIQSSGLVAHEKSTFRNLALAVSGPFMA